MVKKLVWLFLAIKIFSTAQTLESREQFQSTKSVGSSSRGGSFGLENFLTQTFDDDEDFDVNLEVKKEVPKRPITRGQTYGLESMTGDLSGYSNFPTQSPDRRAPQRDRHRKKTGQPLNIRFEKDRMEEKKPLPFTENEKNRYPSHHEDVKDDGEKRNEFLSETVRKPLERPIEFRKRDEIQQQQGPETAATGRPKKRITMRRRKRPTTEAPVATSRDSETPSISNETPKENLIVEQYNSDTDDSVLFSSTASVPFVLTEEPKVGQQRQQQQPFQHKRTRPMGFRTHTGKDKGEQASTVAEEKSDTSAAGKNGSGSSGEDKTNVRADQGSLQPPPSSPSPSPSSETSHRPQPNRNGGDSSTEVDRLKLLLRKHQGSSLSQILQTRNLSLTDLLSGNRQDVIGDSDATTTPESQKPKDHQLRENAKARQDNFPTPSRSNSIPSVKSRPFSKNENAGRLRFTKKKNKDENGNQIDDSDGSGNGNSDHYNNGYKKTVEKIDENEKPDTNEFSQKNRTRKFHKHAERVDQHEKKDFSNEGKTVTGNPSRINKPDSCQDQEGSCKQGTGYRHSTENRKLTTSLLDYRRKHKIPHGNQPVTSDSEPSDKVAPSNVQQESPPPVVPTISWSANEGKREKQVGGKKTFASSNNPELALIFPKSKNYLNDRITGIKFPGLKKEGFKNEIKNDQTAKQDHTDGDHFHPTSRPRDKGDGKEKPDTGKHSVSNKSSDEVKQAATDGEHTQYKTPTNEKNGNVVETDVETAESSKDEILELLKSAATAQKLEKILASRNMTIGELLLNREKGSAQTNFSRLFSSSQEASRPPESQGSTQATIREVAENGGKDATGRRQENLPLTTLFDEMETDESNPVVGRVEISAAQNQNRETRKTDQIHAVQDFARKDRANDFARDNVQSGIDGLSSREKTVNYYNSLLVPVAESLPASTKTKTKSDVYRTAEPGSISSSSSEDTWMENAKINLQANNRNGFLSGEHPTAETEKQIPSPEIDKSFIPPVIKSTIIISGVVMGIALVVFIAIFAACGWRQRQLRLKADSSICNETLTSKSDKKKRASTRAMSPVEIKRSNTYKKTLDFDDSRSVVSASSEASSYLWNTLKNTFTSRNNTLKNRSEKENCLNARERGNNFVKSRDPNDGRTINRQASNNKYQERLNSLPRETEKYFPAWQKPYSDKDLTRKTDACVRGVIVNNNASGGNNNNNSSGNKNYRLDTWTQN